jgi:uncharacterized delta-60 repeat protein
LNNQFLTRAVMVDPSTGAVLVAGGSASFTAARFTSAGLSDATFGTNGVTTFRITSTPGQQADGYAMKVDASGRIVMAGADHTQPTGTASFAVARLTAQGALDSSFNGTGTVSTPVSGTAGLGGAAYALALQADGKIVAAGNGVLPGAVVAVAVARYTDTGTLDATFDGDTGTSDGLVMLDAVPSAGPECARAVAIQSDGKILVAGTSSMNPGPDFTRSPLSKLVVVRLLTDGKRDTTFGTNGVVASNFGFASVVGFAIQALPNGGSYVAGRLFDGVTERGFLARLGANGAFDTSFASGGVYVMRSGERGGLRALLLQPDGKLVAGGHGFSSPTGDDFTLFRLF